MITNVLGKYPFEILHLEGQKSNQSYWFYLPDAYKHNRCFEYLIQGFPHGMRVVEHFGGIGMSGAIVENELHPSDHKMFDIDADCIRNAQHNWGDKAAYGDAKEIMGTVPADLVILDFPNFTVNKLAEWYEPLKRVFEMKPRYVTLADIANQRIGLHRPLYSRLLEKPIFSPKDYINAFSEKFYKEFGYSIRKASYNNKASFFLLTAEPPIEVEPWRYTPEGQF